MKLIIAGRDRTMDIGETLRRAAELLHQGDSSRKPAWIPDGISALTLQQVASDADYLNELIRLMRYRDGVDTLDFKIPGRPGWRGRWMSRIKLVLWRLLRYQHDRIAFRQNLINTLLTSALEFEVAARQKEVAELKQRMAELEKTGGRGEVKIQQLPGGEH